MRKILIQKLRDGVDIPQYETAGAAGCDVRAWVKEPVFVHPGETKFIPLGFAMALPENMAALLLPRSGLGTKSGIVLGNLVGLIDSDYRGEVAVAVWNRNTEGMPFKIGRGDRIAQMVIVPVLRAECVEVDSLECTERGAGGFGSTGNG